MYKKNDDLDSIHGGLTSRASYRYILISKRILKSKENLLHFHNAHVSVYTYDTHVLKSKV